MCAFVGADAHIGPLGSCEFAADFRINSLFCRADVGIGPYDQAGDCIRIRQKTFNFRCCLLHDLSVSFADSSPFRGAFGVAA